MIIEAIHAEAMENRGRRVSIRDLARSLPSLALVLAYGFLAASLVLL